MGADLTAPLEGDALIVIDPYPLADSVNYRLSKGMVPLPSAERWLSRTLSADVKLQHHHGDRFTAWVNGAQQRDLVEVKVRVSRKRASVTREELVMGKQERFPWGSAAAGKIEVAIPTIDWEQVGGDMNPGTYGGLIATADGDHIEMIQIQPVREYMGDKEAADVGFPFWSKEAWFDLNGLQLDNRDVKSALDSVGMDLDTLEEDFTPEQRGMVIAEALLGYGLGEEGPAGWSGDIGIHDQVKWWGGKVAGSEYIADEDDEFVREVLLADLDINHEGFGPDPENPTSGLHVVTRGFTVEITEWTDIVDATGEDQPEGEEVVRRYVEVELDELLDPKGKHRGVYSGDDKGVTLTEVAKMDPKEREDAIVSAAIAYMAYYGGEEEFVDQIGD